MSTSPPEISYSLSEAVAAEIRAEIARRGLRRPAFAASIGVPPHWLTNRLNGSVSINLEDLDRIAVGLGLNPNELLARADR